MTKKKVYEVRLIQTIIQRKQIVADSAKQAREIAERDDMDWQEKEEVDGTNVTVHSGGAYKGKYVEFVDPSNTHTDLERFDPATHRNVKLKPRK